MRNGRGFVGFAGLSLGLVIVAWALIPESLKYLFSRRPADALERINSILRWLKKEPLGRMPEQPTAEHTARPGFVKGMLQLLDKDQRRKTLILWSAFLMCFSTLYFLMSWIPQLMEASGFGAEAGRDAYFLFNLGGVVGIYLVSYLSTRFKLTNLILYLCVAAAISMVIFALVPAQLNLMLALTLLIGIVQQGGFVGLYSTSAKAYPTHIRSTGIGWAIGLGRFGAVVGPAVAGYLIAAGFSMSSNYLIFAIPMALGGIIAYRLHIR